MDQKRNSRWWTYQVPGMPPINAYIFSELIEATPRSWRDHHADIFRKTGQNMTIFGPFLGQKVPPPSHDSESTYSLKSIVTRRHRRLQRWVLDRLIRESLTFQTTPKSAFEVLTGPSYALILTGSRLVSKEYKIAWIYDEKHGNRDFQVCHFSMVNPCFCMFFRN